VLSCASNDFICAAVAQLTTQTILHGSQLESLQNAQFHNVVNEFGNNTFVIEVSLNAQFHNVVNEFHSKTNDDKFGL
jgi:hypothetical protein